MDKTSNEEKSEELQKRIARIQIWSSATITIGGVSLGIGASMWVTAFSLFGTANTLANESPFLLGVVTLFNKLGPLFSLLGFVSILHGFLYPMYLLRRKSQKTELDPTTCHCGNKLPCSIHMS